MGIAACCRGAMGIAAGVGAHRPERRSLRCLRARTHQPTLPPGDRPFRLLFEPVAATTVGAQWELRRALARRDQRLRPYDASACAHVDRRFPGGPTSYAA